MADRYFRREEVERLIPTLGAVMDRVMRAHGEAERIADEMRAEQQRVALAGGALVDRAAWRDAKTRAEALRETVRAGLGEIVDLGGTPKDLSLGLVDFPALRDGRVVNLCWKHGEDAVRFWHGLDEGYAARKPL